MAIPLLAGRCETVMFLRGGLVSIQHRSPDRVELKRMMDLLERDDLEDRIISIGDPFLQEEAIKLARSCWVTR